jgi:hypothetical protein
VPTLVEAGVQLVIGARLGLRLAASVVAAVVNHVHFSSWRQG